MSNTLGYICIMLLLLFASMAVSAQESDDPPTILSINLSGSPWGNPHIHRQSTVPSSAVSVASSVPVGGDDSAFRWVAWQSGPPACVWTADYKGDHQENVGGGRNLHAGAPHAFIRRGYHTFAAQGNCDSLRVPICSGACN